MLPSQRTVRWLAPLLLLAVPVLAAAAGARWRPVPLDGGAISGLGAGAGSSAAVWAVTPFSGVFRSLDNGTTWSRTRTPTLHVFRSRDGGRRWERLDAGLPAGRLLGAVTLDAERRLLFIGIEGRGLHVLNVR